MKIGIIDDDVSFSTQLKNKIKKEEMILRNRLSFLLFIMLRTLPFYLFLFARNSLIF